MKRTNHISGTLLRMAGLLGSLSFAAAAAAGVAANGVAATGEEDVEPAAACHEQARSHGTDLYPCDLALQIARDSAAPQEVAQVLGNRALVLMRTGNLEAALGDLREALEQQPQAAALHSNLGNLLLRLQRPHEALAAHDRAVRLAPEQPVFLFNRAFSLRATGQRTRAAEDAAAARRLQDSIRGADNVAADASRDR